MRRKALFLAAGVAICGAVACVVLLRSGSGCRIVTIISEPAGATVEVDGRYFGVTPARLEDLPDGLHQVKLTKHGFVPVTAPVTIPCGAPDKHIVLKRIAYGSLVVASMPSEATVVLDGETLGATPRRVDDVEAGLHELRIHKTSFEPWRQEIRIEPEAELAVEAELQTRFEKYYLDAIEREPNVLSSYTELGYHYTLHERYDKAFEMWAKDGEVVIRTGSSTTKGYGELLTALRKAWRKEGEDFRSRIESALNALLSKYPKSLVAYRLLYDLLYVGGPVEQAIAIANRCRAALPEQSEPYLWLLRLYRKAKLFDKVAELHAEMRKNVPQALEQPDTQFEFALLYQRMGDAKRLREVYASLTQRFPYHPWTAVLAGEVWAQERTGNPPKNTVFCRATDAPPTIDGDLSDPCWQTAGKASNFIHYQTRRPVSQQTACLLTRDAEHLYIGFECYEESPLEICKTVRGRDNNVWNDDCVELFLDTDRDYHTYVQMMVNPIGTLYDMKGTRELTDRMMRHVDRAWNPECEVVARILVDRWRVEMAIPLAELTQDEVKKGTVWRLNANRARRAGRLEISGWSYPRGDNHQPWTWGLVVFE